MRWEFLTADTLSCDLILAIYRKEIPGVRIPDYCPPEVARTLAEALLHESPGMNYEVRWYRGGEKGHRTEFRTVGYEPTDVDRVGPTDSAPEPDGAAASAWRPLAMIRWIRAQVAPCLSPVDRLRLELDEVLPMGANLSTRPDGTKAMVGVGRVMHRSDELVHADTGRRGCLTENIYLRPPEEGGETRVWNYSGAFLDSPGSYLFEPGEIPSSAPSCLLRPAAGELAIWNPACPHVVHAFRDGPRVSIQTWLQITGSINCGSIGTRLLN